MNSAKMLFCFGVNSEMFYNIFVKYLELPKQTR